MGGLAAAGEGSGTRRARGAVGSWHLAARRLGRGCDDSAGVPGLAGTSCRVTATVLLLSRVRTWGPSPPHLRKKCGWAQPLPPSLRSGLQRVEVVGITSLILRFLILVNLRCFLVPYTCCLRQPRGSCFISVFLLQRNQREAENRQWRLKGKL